MNEIELEQEVIGTFLLNKSAKNFIGLLDESDFVDEFFKCVFRSIDKRKDDKFISQFDIAQEVGCGVTEISNLTKRVISKSLIESNIAALKENSAKRKLMGVVNGIGDLLMDNKSADDVINETLKKISDIRTIQNNDVVKMTDAFMNYLEELERRYKEKDNMMLMGLKELDEITAGLHKQELTCIGARPSVGKTAIALQIAKHIADSGKRVLFVSLEMSEIQLIERYVIQIAKVDSKSIRNGDLKEEDFDEIASRGDYFNVNMDIDTNSLTPEHVRRKILDLNPDVVLIDYVGLMRARGRFNSPREELKSITRSLKLMTRELNKPIVMLSQLNRAAQNKQPTLRELKESGSLEEDSDNVLFVHRCTEDEDYEELKDINKFETGILKAIEKNGFETMMLIIAKQRNGKRSTIPMLYQGSIFKFVELEPIYRKI